MKHKKEKMAHHTLCFSCIRHKFLWVGVGSNQSFWLSSLALLQWVVKLVSTHWELGDTWAWIPTKSISQITVIEIDPVEYKKQQTSYGGGGPKAIPEEEEACSCKSDEDWDSSDGGGVSLPLRRETPSVDEVRPWKRTKTKGVTKYFRFCKMSLTI